MSKNCSTCIHCYARDVDCLGACVHNGDCSDWYSLYEFGDPAARLFDMQKTGKRDFVIGGAGEAEIYATDKPDVSFRKLCRIADLCGYLCYGYEVNEEYTYFNIDIHSTTYRVFFVKNKLSHIRNWNEGNIVLDLRSQK